MVTKVQIARARARVSVARLSGESLPDEVLQRAKLDFADTEVAAPVEPSRTLRVPLEDSTSPYTVGADVAAGDSQFATPAEQPVAATQRRPGEMELTPEEHDKVREVVARWQRQRRPHQAPSEDLQWAEVRPDTRVNVATDRTGGEDSTAALLPDGMQVTWAARMPAADPDGTNEGAWLFEAVELGKDVDNDADVDDDAPARRRSS